MFIFQKSYITKRDQSNKNTALCLKVVIKDLKQMAIFIRAILFKCVWETRKAL